ncbi:LysR family transcriptional regulator [Leptothrix discophora]|uniref:LysR family transcriptional regulator n=1 Tax=Leptothrix discophora TaxID=89 RepID=A0ABT9FYQ9_LEPDI|nr:LysR family transcriptional regulator [Leptothrix discophora]MDP4299364.1 LysR family transcriptional regulator [Leptothrix discophora]
MELRDVDLNLLLLFHHLMAERRVTPVAERLGITQPAVSNALARLRRQFDDELFLRTPAGMVPTPLAEQLAGPVGEALALIHRGLNPPTSFDPARVRCAMTLAMTDIGEIVFLPALVERIGREAPGVSLSTVRSSAVHLQDDMAAGRVDLAIGLLPQLKAGYFQRQLFRQPYVCLFRRGHPLDRPGLTLADFRAAEHLVVLSAGTGHGKVDERLKRAGVERTVRLRVPHFVGVGHILQGTDLVATVPERLAQRLAGPFGLTWRVHPVELPEAPIKVFWHAKAHRDAANLWLRGRVFELFADPLVAPA